MDINYDKFLAAINDKFPPIPFLFCYGSAAFPQTGYNYSKETPMIDLIFVVEDYCEWHQQNFEKNRSHYSGLGYVFGARFLSYFERNFIPIHYNPFVKFESFEIKYGVVSVNEILNNLNSWRNLVVAGRMHKPIRILKNSSTLYSEKILQALQANYINALTVSFLLNYDKFVPEEQLFITICSLSYIGDIRILIGLEKKDKIEGIVKKQEDLFRKIYCDVIDKTPLGKIIKYHANEKQFEIINYEENKNKFIENLPYEIGINYTGSNKNYQEIMKTKKLHDIQNHIIKSLKKNNLNYSIRLIFYHFLTTSFIKNFVYSWNKLKKRLK